MRTRLGSYKKNSVCLGFLAESEKCDFFDELRLSENNGEYPFQITDLNNCLLLQEQGYEDLYLFAGRQIITEERLEILALTTNEKIPNGLSIGEVVDRVNSLGAIPVLAWSPGKWFGNRGKIVKEMITRYSPTEFLIGDTTLRPMCWLEPVLMRQATKKGFAVVAGSDPLPFSGEEQMLGRYVSGWNMEFERHDPVTSVRCYLKTQKVVSQSIGSRGNIIGTLRRLYLNSLAKRDSNKQ